MLDSIEIETAPNPRWTVLWLHGLGADGHDFEPIVPQLVAPGLAGDPLHLPARPGAAGHGQWRHADARLVRHPGPRDRQPPGRARHPRFDPPRRAPDRPREHARRADESRLILAGFSQGGAIALAAGVRHRRTLAGIVALSTYLPLGDRTEPELHPANRATPIWFGHGDADPVVPARLGQMSCEWLRARGYPVQWHTWPMPHSVCAEEIAALRDLARGSPAQ